MATGRIPLVECIAQLEEPRPTDYDPEDLEKPGTEVVGTHYVDVGPSALRNALPSVVDRKYQGVRMSRKQLLEESDDERETSTIEIDNAPEEMSAEEHTEQEDSFSCSRSSDTEESGQTGSEDDQSRQLSTNMMTPTEGQAEDVSIALKKSREADIQKGQAVKAQLQLWDTLLDTRIRLQKSVVAANRFPPPSLVDDFLESPDCRNAALGFLREVYMLTELLDDLQETLLTNNSMTAPPPKKRRKLELDATLGDYSKGLVAATEDAAALEETVHPFLLQTLSKWSAKIQAVAPSTLVSSNRGAFLRGNQHIKSAVQLIDENFVDKTKLLERTQTIRSQKPRIGVSLQEPEGGILDPEIFDDTDFYQKTLRDIIDSRGSGLKNEDWQLLQKRKKSKKNVETKASKGRKLRFGVHEKIQNFMVPVPVVGAWHDDQTDELFSSLLGKGFENAVVNSEETQVHQTVEQAVELTGFRVFG